MLIKITFRNGVVITVTGDKLSAEKDGIVYISTIDPEGWTHIPYWYGVGEVEKVEIVYGHTS